MIFCDNKGCGKESAVVIDKATKEVYCTECDKPITNVTVFAKNQLVSLGQVKRVVKSQKAFAVKCEPCQKEAPPELDRKTGNLICTFCKQEIKNISAPFKEMLKANLAGSKKQI